VFAADYKPHYNNYARNKREQRIHVVIDIQKAETNYGIYKKYYSAHGEHTKIIGAYHRNAYKHKGSREQLSKGFSQDNIISPKYRQKEKYHSEYKHCYTRNNSG
jgi:hypothetical protein